MKLLKKLYMIHSPSRREEAMKRFIAQWLDKYGIPYTKDSSGNILATKGEAETYPCVAAHMDEVHHERPDDYIIHRDGDVMYAFSASNRGLHGIGADDKNGIWVALNVLKQIKVVKAAFFVGEEVGCIGSSTVDMNFFDNCRFVIQADRKNGGDFIQDASGVPLCTEDFLLAMHASEYGYKKTYGLMTDVMELRRRGLKCCACNLSCGYYNPHTNNEITVISELRNCLKMVLNACISLKDVYVAPAYTEKKTGYSSYGNYWGYYDDYDYKWYSGSKYKQSDKKDKKDKTPLIIDESYKYDPADDYEDTLYSMAECWSITDALETAIIKQAEPKVIGALQKAKNELDKTFPLNGICTPARSMSDCLSYAKEMTWLTERELEDILYAVDDDWKYYSDNFTLCDLEADGIY